MRFILSFVFVAFVFYAQAEEDDFIAKCKRDGTIDIVQAFQYRLSLPLSKVSTCLSKTYTESLQIALKHTGCKSKSEHERIRKAIECHLQSCVKLIYGSSTLADQSLQLSERVKTLIKARCNVISKHEKGSLNQVTSSNDVQKTLNKQSLQGGAIGGLLNNIKEGLVVPLFAFLQKTLSDLGLGNILNGIIATVETLLVKILGDLEGTLSGSLSSSSSSSTSVSRSEVSREDVFYYVYQCDLGDGSNKIFESCEALSAGIDKIIQSIIRMQGPFEECLAKKYTEIVDNCDLVLKTTCRN